MGKAIAIFNQKGGVGKTTTNINLAACLALKGKRVLVLDVDPQGNTTSGLGISKKDLANTSYDLLIDSEMRTRDTILPTSVKGLDIIPASVDLAGAEIELVQIQGREKRLQKALEEVRGD
jgi:chromosome partitioning protein